MAQKALDFDKIDDIVIVDAHASLNNIFDSGGTVEAWIKPDSPGLNDNGRVADKGSTAGWILYCRFIADGGKIKIAFLQGFTTTAGGWYTTDYEVTLGAWNYVAVTYDNGNVANDPIFYVNGSPVAITEDVEATPEGTRLDDSALDLEIGNRTDKARTFEGIIEEVRLSTKIRTSTEISDIWNSGSGVQFEVDGDTVALWHFNEGANSTVYDETANDNDGTIDGASWIDGYVFERHLSLADTGFGVEASLFTFKDLFSAEGGSGAEASSLLAILTSSETGSGIEALLSRALASAGDTGSGVGASLALLATLTSAETGAGVDASLALLAVLTGADTGSGVDALVHSLLTEPAVYSGSSLIGRGIRGVRGIGGKRGIGGVRGLRGG